MSNLNARPIQRRIEIGNAQADLVRLEINSQYNLNPALESFSGTELDKEDMIDFGTPNLSLTGQCKVRSEPPLGSKEQYDDLIFETDQFWPELSSDGESTVYRREPGRDARCKADFYAVRPWKKPICLPETNEVKKMIKEVLFEWGVPLKATKTKNGLDWQLVDFTDKQIKKYWQQAGKAASRSVELFRSKDGVVVKFKIDEGQEGIYGKLLFFVPPGLFVNVELLKLKDKIYGNIRCAS